MSGNAKPSFVYHFVCFLVSRLYHGAPACHPYPNVKFYTAIRKLSKLFICPSGDPVLCSFWQQCHHIKLQPHSQQGPHYTTLHAAVVCVQA